MKAFGERAGWCDATSICAPLAAAVAVVSIAGSAAAQQTVQRPPIDTTPPAALAFQGTTVIDVQTGRRMPNQTIVVIGNRIQAVGPASRVRLPAGTRVLPADGTFVIPGLWDMHVHVMGFPNTFFPLFLANGVTGVRDMGAPSLDSMLRWRREIKEGQRAGPRLVTAGPMITSHETVRRAQTYSHGRFAVHVIGADTVEEGQRLVDSLKKAGADFIAAFIKVYHPLWPDASWAIIDQAREAELPVSGPLSGAVSALAASDSGLHSLEHGLGLAACQTSIEPTLDLGQRGRPDQPQCRQLAARLRRNDTWVLPGPYVACGACQMPWAHEQDRYWPDSLYAPWQVPAQTAPHEPWVVSVSLAQWADLHRGTPPLRLAAQAGIRFLVGSDLQPWDPFRSRLRPGFALQERLWDLVQGGLTPLEALQTATLHPAQYFHATDSLGTIAPGKVADLVFLDADPLQDIFNTRRIRAVVADGRFYDRPDLDALLVGAERLAQRSRRP